MNYSALAASMPPFTHDTPAFMEKLKEPPFFSTVKAERAPAKDETNGASGLFPLFNFPDPEELLATALHDLTQFLEKNGYAGNRLPIEIRKAAGPADTEEAIITVTGTAVTIESGDTEGIRRGIYEIMDRLTASPFLKQGVSHKKFFIRNRISRCFFGPIKRPPYNVDELMNDVDYYPENYLSRLAREGVNGVWITAVFREICATSLLASDAHRMQRIAKLCRTVEKCRKYGIRIWLFFLEPLDISGEFPDGEVKESLRGPGGSFCPKSKEAAQYLFDCGFSLFRDVPRLGGIILMTLGERTTSCLNAIPYYHCFSKKTLLRDIPPANACPGKCSLSGAEILSRVVNPLRNGMKTAAPESELIVQFYTPGADKMYDEVFDIADGLPGKTAFVFNYESSVTVSQLGKSRTGADYWLSVPGPSDRFGRMAEKFRGRCEMGAKIQVCCSHELATVPYLPVPAMLYRKYLQMRSLGVRHVLQCWYFGNYPGVMNHAAGLLSCEDFSGSEEAFYRKLAGACGLHDPENVVRAWNCFAHAYSFYPLSTIFQYYGPAHHGIVWPLYLRQVCRHLPQSWLPDTRPAGDAICECLGSHTLAEAAALCQKMADRWEEGLRIFRITGNKEEEILYSAIGILFFSCADILSFYELRRHLAEETAPAHAEKLLDRMAELVKKEIGNCRKMVEYCRADSRLGYHSEAEVCKFFPEKIAWRERALTELLEKEFPSVREELRQGKAPWKVLADTSEMHRIGETCSASLFSVKVEENLTDKMVRIGLREMDAAADSVIVNFSDVLCTSVRYSMTAVISGKQVTLYDPSTAGTAELSEDGKELFIRIPAPLLPERFRVGVLRSVTTKDGTRHTGGWPYEDAKPVGNLELYCFDPANLALMAPAAEDI